MRAFDLTFAPSRPWTTRVHVGEGVLDDLVGEIASRLPDRRVLLVSDEQVAPLHAEPLLRRLRSAGSQAELLTFPAGERHKTRRTKAILEDRLAELGAGHDSVFVAVGGGVTGDLAGFLAATWHRGVPLIQVPTSLLAMADAALGGKTAVNHPSGKNLVGSFHQPLSVYADVTVLGTLDLEAYREGFGEVVKTAVIADAELFDWLEKTVEPLLSRAADAVVHAVSACMRIKGAVVAADEREAGRRAMLNFGHTVAHAIEAASGYTVRHGSAVAGGMCVEAALAVDATGFPSRDVERLRALLGRFGLPTVPPSSVDVESIVGATRRDKKNRGGRVRYALPSAIGGMVPGPDVCVDVDESRLRRVLKHRPN